MRARCTAVVAAAVALAPLSAFAATVTHVRHEHGQVLNDLRKTAGETFQVGTSTICVRGYASSVRHVTLTEKRQVYAEYGLAYPQPSGYFEIDHLISLELGGDNSIGNLWPERNDHPSSGYLNSKDKLENRLHSLVCHGTVPLKTAQHAIATDWVQAYHRYVGGWPKPVP